MQSDMHKCLIKCPIHIMCGSEIVSTNKLFLFITRTGDFFLPQFSFSQFFSQEFPIRKIECLSPGFTIKKVVFSCFFVDKKVEIQFFNGAVEKCCLLNKNVFVINQLKSSCFLRMKQLISDEQMILPTFYTCADRVVQRGI
jgi:hypothetical protein